MPRMWPVQTGRMACSEYPGDDEVTSLEAKLSCRLRRVQTRAATREARAVVEQPHPRQELDSY